MDSLAVGVAAQRIVRITQHLEAEEKRETSAMHDVGGVGRGCFSPYRTLEVLLNFFQGLPYFVSVWRRSCSHSFLFEMLSAVSRTAVRFPARRCKTRMRKIIPAKPGAWFVYRPHPQRGEEKKLCQ